MNHDEQQIRDLVAAWHAATRAGDVDAVLAMIADDAVFLTAGRPPMDKAEFARVSRSLPGTPRPTIDAASDIQEIVVSGDWAFMWTRLRVTITPPGGASMQRAGHTLTIFRRLHGRWQLARDANLLAPVAHGT